MINENQKEIAKLRFENAENLLKTSKMLIEYGDYKSAANRSYYAIFNSMRAVLATLGMDFKNHGVVIAKFREHFMKTDIIDRSLSPIITSAFEVRNGCDYNDHYMISKTEVIQQVDNATLFLNRVKDYLIEINVLEQL